MNVLKLAAFSQNGQGGNPAGVAFYDEMPSAEEMLKIAAEVGYASEAAFSRAFKKAVGTAPSHWRKQRGNGHAPPG